MLFIEKLSQAEGLKRNKAKEAGQSIKSNSLERLKLMEFFHKKYKWYFEKRQQLLKMEEVGTTKGSMTRELKIVD